VNLVFQKNSAVLGWLLDGVYLTLTPKRQRTYFQALRKLYPNKIAIIEEKKSDVNIAVDMLQMYFVRGVSISSFY